MTLPNRFRHVVGFVVVGFVGFVVIGFVVIGFVVGAESIDD
jgi:hypothetical protein